MCDEQGVGLIDLWGYFVGKEDVYMRDGLHLSRKQAVVFCENLLRSVDRFAGGGVTVKPNTGGIDKKAAQRNQQRTVWKSLLNLVINVFV